MSEIEEAVEEVIEENKDIVKQADFGYKYLERDSIRLLTRKAMEEIEDASPMEVKEVIQEKLNE